MNVWVPIFSFSLFLCLSLYPSLLENVHYIAQIFWICLWDESTCDLHREILYRHETYRKTTSDYM